ncbi:hypothetical protein V0288_07970 [Pannus brasiliensis CCIBt3594]|uniref:Uncharacterized protein n=1 Tax=Pannus brasiliensis CCIBt3594 TaxID=1427578 RepID=A0AAW9QS56_9CHRO
MKAIVLTYDKYMKFAEHTIYTYQKFWPSHPFTFRVPYGENPLDRSRFGDRVELVQMDCARALSPAEIEKSPKLFNPIKETVLTLLKDLPDEEWIFWCMDDRYIMRIQEDKVNDIHDFVIDHAGPDVLVVNYARNRAGGYFKSDKYIKEGVEILTPKGQILRETVYSDGTYLPDTWSHQFIRVKGIRRIFESFPDRPFVAKTMDSFDLPKLPGEKQLMVENNLVVFGESTSRGEITENCVASFKRWKMELPSNMTISSKYHVIGELPYQWMGVTFTLPRGVKRRLTDVTRWYWRNI